MTNPSKSYSFKIVDDNLHINGVAIELVPTPALLSAWKDLSRTKIQKTKMLNTGASLLEELASRIAEEKAYSVNLNIRIDDRDSKIVGLEDNIKEQEKIIDLLREHCKKASVIQVVQGTKIKSLEKDKEYLHDLIEYQKGSIK